MTKEELLADMVAKGACCEAKAFVAGSKRQSAEAIGLDCKFPGWLAWYLVRAKVDCQNFTFACADRAVRVHAVKALRVAGLEGQADELAALPAVVDVATASGAYNAIHTSASALTASAYAAAYVAYVAADAADTDVAYVAAYAASAYAAAAACAADADAERETQLADLHALWALHFGGGK